MRNSILKLEDVIKGKFNTPTLEGAILIIAKKTHNETKNYSIPISLNNITKKFGIKTISNNSLKDDALLFIENGSYKIEFSKPKNWKRQRFTIAHEIFHVIIYELFHDIIDFSKVDISELERLCDKGASELLIPTKSIKADVNTSKLTVDFLNKLSERYKVSFSAVCWKINQIYPEKSIYIWRRYARNEKDNIEYRVYMAFQSYTSNLVFPYIPVGCTIKHLSNKEIFHNDSTVESGKLYVKLAKQTEYAFYLERIKIKKHQNKLFDMKHSDATDFLMILNTIK